MILIFNIIYSMASLGVNTLQTRCSGECLITLKDTSKAGDKAIRMSDLRCYYIDAISGYIKSLILRGMDIGHPNFLLPTRSPITAIDLQMLGINPTEVRARNRPPLPVFPPMPMPAPMPAPMPGPMPQMFFWNGTPIPAPVLVNGVRVPGTRPVTPPRPPGMFDPNRTIYPDYYGYGSDSDEDAMALRKPTKRKRSKHKRKSKRKYIKK